MTPEILPLLAASLACISVLAFFARHNQRTGWVKPRRVSLEEFAGLEMDWKDYPAPVYSVEAESKVVVPEAIISAIIPSSRDVTNFTLQLAHFHDALAVGAAKPVEERERVSV